MSLTANPSNQFKGSSIDMNESLLMTEGQVLNLLPELIMIQVTFDESFVGSSEVPVHETVNYGVQSITRVHHPNKN